jgi:hypothetical protein
MRIAGKNRLPAHLTVQFDAKLGKSGFFDNKFFLFLNVRSLLENRGLPLTPAITLLFHHCIPWYSLAGFCHEPFKRG